MSRRATREAHSKIVSRQRTDTGLLDDRAYLEWKRRKGRIYPGCLSALALALLVASCIHGPSAQDQADLQLVAVAVEQAGACVPPEQAQQAQAALGRLGVSLSAQAQARAIWEAAGQVAGVAWPWVLEQVARPPP